MNDIVLGLWISVIVRLCSVRVLDFGPFDVAERERDKEWAMGSITGAWRV